MPLSTAALIRRDSRYLFVRRRSGGDLGGCWELPGGKVDEGESPEEALRRELAEELGVAASVGRLLGEARFEHDGRSFRLLGFEVDANVDSITLYEHEESALLTVSEALGLNLAPSDASLLADIRDRL